MSNARQHLRWIVYWGVILLCLVILENIEAGRWEAISQLPTQRKNFATAVVDGKIYLIGGTLFENRRGPYGLSTVEVFDTQTNTWQHVAEMPTPRASAGAAVVDGVIYVCAGYNGIDNHAANLKFLDIVEAYNPQTDTWTRKQDMPTARVQFGIGAVDGKIYAMGGTVHFFEIQAGVPGRLALVEVYDPATDIWRKRANMPTKRDGLGVGVVNNRIYAIGGNGWPQGIRGGPFLMDIEMYDPHTHRWQQKPKMLELRTSFSTVVGGDDIYLIGGFTGEAGNLRELATVAVYHPQTETWREIPAMPVPIRPLGAAAVGGKIYVFGGIGEGREFVPDVWVYDTGSRALEAKGKLATRWGELKTDGN